MVPLGSEAERFRRIVAAHAQYADAGGPMSRPWLTASSLADPTGADLYRELLTRLWPPDASRPHVPISDLRRVLEFLDALPPGMQATVGRWILRKRGELRTGSWASGAVMWSGDRLLVFGCARADRYDEVERLDADLAAIVCVRSRKVREQGGLIAAVLGVGHLVADGYIDYRYIYMEPPVEAPDDLKRIVLHTYGRFDLTSGRTVEITAARERSVPLRKRAQVQALRRALTYWRPPERVGGSGRGASDALGIDRLPSSWGAAAGQGAPASSGRRRRRGRTRSWSGCLPQSDSVVLPYCSSMLAMIPRSGLHFLHQFQDDPVHQGVTLPGSALDALQTLLGQVARCHAANICS